MMRLLRFLALFLAFSLGQPVSAASLGDIAKNRKGASAYEGGDMGEALSAYSSAVSDGTELGEVYNNLGNVYYKQKDYEKAEQSYLQALERLQDEKKGQVFYNLGNTTYSKGQLQDAVKYFEQALALDPGNVDAKYNLEIVLNELKNRSNNTPTPPNPNKKKPPPPRKKKAPPKPPPPLPPRKKKQQEQDRNRLNNLLNLLDQKEREARNRHLKNETKEQSEVEKDW